MPIYHILPAGQLHHTPTMMSFLRDACNGFETYFYIEGNYQQEQIVFEKEDVRYIPSLFAFPLWSDLEVGKDLVVIHSIRSNKEWRVLFNNYHQLACVVWQIWGADFYSLKQEFQTLHSKLFPSFILTILLRLGTPIFFKSRHLRRAIVKATGAIPLPSYPPHFLRGVAIKQFILPKLHTVATLLDNEQDILRKTVRVPVKMACLGYPPFAADSVTTNLTTATISALVNRPVPLGSKTVLVGNSRGSASRHLYCFHTLSVWDDRTMTVICPLNYGIEDEGYIQEVLTEGQRLFGDRFIPLLEMLPRDTYVQLLSQMDIVFFAHKRQQALFSVYNCLKLGITLFLDDECPTYQALKSFNAHVFRISVNDTLSAKYFNVPMDVDMKRENQKIYDKYLSTDVYINKWQKFLHTHMAPARSVGLQWSLI